jgi:DNA-binding transcriptional LysR family regulator
VAREGNVTRAAELLHLTQPAISLQLKRLAADTGVALFRRTASGLELTRDGAVMVKKAEQVLAAGTEFSQTARNLCSHVRGKLRIGTVVDPEFTRLGSLLKALVEGGPGIETELRHGMSGEVPIGLRRDKLDVGFFLGDIGEFESDDEPAFYVRELARLSYRVVAPPFLGALVRGRDWTDLAGLPWIGTPPASVHHRLLTRVFGGLGVRQNLVALVDQETSMLAMVRTGVGLSLCRESIALDQQQAHGLVIADRVRLETSLSFVALNARRREPIIMLAFDAVSRIWGTLD